MNVIQNKTFDMERALYGSRDVSVQNCSFDGPSDGESAFKECSHVQAEHCFFNLRYPFWHAKNIVVRDSIVKGEYLAWYCENVTFERWKIIGTQPLCYCKNLKLIDCEMEGADLAFERNDVQSTVTTPVISIKNPYAGRIVVPAVGEIIWEDENAKGKIVVVGQQNKNSEHCCCVCA